MSILLFTLVPMAFLPQSCAHNPSRPPQYEANASGEGPTASAATANTSPGSASEEGGKELFPFGDEEEEEETIADPLAIWNKGMYHFNDAFYFWVLKPVTRTYSYIVPEDFRLVISNFSSHLLTPVRFVNNVLQLKMKAAGTELLRFAINTVAGCFGLADVARTELDIKIQEEDFGQTLGTYGIGHGFYLVWPFLGPSSLRDSFGLAGDLLLNPVSYITPLEDAVGVTAFNTVNKTSFRIGDYEALKEAAIDPYVALRNAYFQHRGKEQSQ